MILFMSTVFNKLGCINTCVGCPLATTLNARADQLNQPSESQFSQAQLAMLKADAEKASQQLNTVAGQIACQNIQKDLPPVPAQVPIAGAPEFMDYASACPSFAGFLALRQSEAQGA